MKNTLRNAFAVLSSALATVAFASDVDVGDGANDNTYTDSSEYAGATKIIKTGTGKTTIDFGTYDAKPNFSGEIEVRQGTLAVLGISNLGEPAKITVSDGATLDLTTQESTQPTSLQATEIVIEGTGDGDAGAFVRGGAKSMNNLFRTLTLNGDATITINTQTGQGSGSAPTLGVVNLNGHTLTVSGSARYYCNNVRFYGSDGTTNDPGNIVVDGALYLHNAYALEGGSAKNVLTIKNGKTLVLCNTKSLKWTVNAEGDATILDENTQSSSDRDILEGPVTFGNDATLTAGSSDSSRIRFIGNDVTFNHAMDINGSGQVVFQDANVTCTAAARVKVKHDDIATLRLRGDTCMQGILKSGIGQTRFYIGGDNTSAKRGSLVVENDAVVTNFSLNIGDNGSSGAIYQRGGASHWRLGKNGDSINDRIANASGSYGYIGQTGGRFEFNTRSSSDSKTAYVAVGGTAVFAAHGGTASFVNSDAIGFSIRNYGTFAYYQDNGATNTFDQGFDFGDTNNRNYSGHALVTVSGAGTELAVSRWMRFLWENAGASAYLNLNDGGALRLPMLYSVTNSYPWYVSLNGGILKPTLTDSSFTYKNSVERYPTRMVVCEKGFVIDTSDAKKSDGSEGGNVSMLMPFTAPETAGRRLKSIALPADAAFAQEKLVGPPLVTVSGDGAGASAFALFNDMTRTVTNIVVTSPGWGYTTATVTLSAGGLSQDYTCAVTLEDQPENGWKGFTKRGAVCLDMFGANTFKGDVTVEEGVLGFMKDSVAQNGMPEGAGATINEGATLTFRYPDTPVTVPFLAGCGSTSNGYFTVTNRIECKAADIFAGKHLTVGCNLTLADGVKIVVTDPENLVSYRDRPAATVVSCGGTLVAQGSLVVEFSTPCETESLELWRARVKGNSVVLGHRKGMILMLR